MKWCEITVNTDSEGTELIADAFFSIGCAGGVKITDVNDVLDIIAHNKMWDYVDENLLKADKSAKVSGFVSLDEKDGKIKELKEYLVGEGVPFGEINTSVIDDESWVDTWKKYYRPIEAGRYDIVPKWINHNSSPEKIKILMDPGMAFGTGEHESTKMCLMLMSGIDFNDKAVIDVGTGSGILGIAAIKSGAKSCYMCDIDSVAVKAAKENAELNGVLPDAVIELADLLVGDRKADAVLANLTAGILIRLSEGLSAHMNKGGVLICSGIIHERKKEVIDAFESAGFVLSEALSLGEWDGLKFLWI